MRQIGKQQIVSALRVLGVLEEFEQTLTAVRAAKNTHVVQRLLATFKEEAEASYKKLARIHHPDVGGDEEVMQKINAAWDIVKVLKLRQAPPPMPHPTFVRVYASGAGLGGIHATTTNTTTSTGTSSTSSSFFPFGQPFWVRVRTDSK